MSIRLKVFWGFFAVILLSIALIVRLIFADLEPRYRETIEEPLVDIARLMASIIEVNSPDGDLRTEIVRSAVERARARVFDAQIYEFTKTAMDLRVYVTDGIGRVIYDSENRIPLGEDYSTWRDIKLTLEGSYGSRTSRDHPEVKDSSVMFVAAPIFGVQKDSKEEFIGGVVSIGKPTKSFKSFINRTKYRLMLSAATILLVALGIAHLLAFFLTRPIEKLTAYAHAVGTGRRPAFKLKASGEIGKLATAFEDMRESLEGKRYIEKYVETLTHEIKSPISAIKGSAELLSEAMPEQDRARFLENIKSESERLQALVEKLLLLSKLEAKDTISERKEIDPKSMIEKIITSLAPRLQKKKIEVTVAGTAGTILGDPFLVEQAIRNVVENGVDFSSPQGTIEITLKEEENFLVVEISDRGPGIPDYALPKVFDRFYGLSRPENERKSTGLGLSFVKEVCELHGGKASIENRVGGGATAKVSFLRVL